MSDFGPVKPPHSPAASGISNPPSKDSAIRFVADDGADVYLNQDALLRLQVVLQGAGYARSHIPLRFRPSDDLDVALKRLGLNPYHHKRELSVLLGSNIWCAVIFQGTASPIEVDLDEFYGKSHRTMEGERFSVSLNKRGDVLEIHRAGAYSQKNIMGSVWKALVGRDVPLAPTPIVVENVHTVNGLDRGFNDGESNYALLHRRPAGDFVSPEELLDTGGVGERVIIDAIANMRRIVYGLRRRGIYAVDDWNFLVDRTTGDVVLGNMKQPVIADSGLLRRPIDIPQELLDIRMPYLPSVMRADLDSKHASVRSAEEKLADINDKLRSRLELPWQREACVSDEVRASIADEYAREIHLKIRLARNWSPWWEVSARSFFATLFDGDRLAMLDNGINLMAKELAAFGDWPIGEGDDEDKERLVRESLRAFMHKRFEQVPDNITHEDLVELAMDIVHIMRVQERNRSAIRTPPVEVLRPVVDELMRVSDEARFARSPLPDLIVQHVDMIPYIPTNEGMNASYAMNLLASARSAFQTGVLPLGGTVKA